MAKIITVDEAAEKIKDGMRVMIGGFMGCGNPHSIIDALVRRNAKELTVICNDGAWPGFGVAKLITNNQVKKLILKKELEICKNCSIGDNPVKEIIKFKKNE